MTPLARTPQTAASPPATCAVATVEATWATVEKYSIGLNDTRNVVYENCVQVHPWLLKRAFIEDVGYFDARFSPHIHEDDDLWMRMLRGGWKAAAVRVRVWVGACVGAHSLCTRRPHPLWYRYRARTPLPPLRSVLGRCTAAA